jgi:hypothetical protein
MHQELIVGDSEGMNVGVFNEKVIARMTSSKHESGIGHNDSTKPVTPVTGSDF